MQLGRLAAQGACPLASAAPRRHAARRGAVRVQAADAFCKDMVNKPRESNAVVEGVSKVVFLGANGVEVEVECAKVTGEEAAA